MIHYKNKAGSHAIYISNGDIYRYGCMMHFYNAAIKDTQSNLK